MIEFVKEGIETPLTLSECYIRTLRLEGGGNFYRTVNELIALFDGEDSPFTCWDGDEMIKPAKYGDMVVNLFTFDLNDKKVLTLLYKQLEADYFNGEGILSFNEINSKIHSFILNDAFDYPFTLDVDDITFANLLKLCNVRVSSSADTLIEKLVCYINLLVSLKKSRFFIFVNIKSFLSDDELEMLFNHCINEKVALMFIESGKGKSLPFEKSVIITEDLCELLENDSDL